MTILANNTSCQNPVGGRVCGYELPEVLQDFNGKVRGKIEKHTNEPTGTFSGEISFNPSTGFYLKNLNAARSSGEIYLDTSNGYFFTYIAPEGRTAIAKLCVGSSTNQFEVSGFKMPLNSKLQNFHGHYSNLDQATIYVAAPEGAEIASPCANHPEEFRVIQGGEVIAAWNVKALSGFAGDHVIHGNS